MVMTFFIVGLLLTAVVQSGYGMHTGLHRQRMTDIGQPLANYVGWIRQAEGANYDDSPNKKGLNAENQPANSEGREFLFPMMLSDQAAKEGDRQSALMMSDEQLSSFADKRDNYLSMCHFKICNLGRKRRISSQGTALSPWSPVAQN